MPRRHRAAIAVIAIVALCLLAVWRCGPASLPPLARNLPSDYETAERVFDRRVRTAYPIGSPTMALMADLRRQGFRTEPSGEVEIAEISRFNGCGSTIWRVVWRADHAGRITDIHGVHGAICI